MIKRMKMLRWICRCVCWDELHQSSINRIARSGGKDRVVVVQTQQIGISPRRPVYGGQKVQILIYNDPIEGRIVQSEFGCL